MLKDLKAFVPSKVCLSCDGCCRFKEQDSEWRAKIFNIERINPERPSLVSKIFSSQSVDSRGQLKSVSCGDHHRCLYFNPQDHTCQVYGEHPLECRLYPFLLSKNNGRVDVYVHVSCPFVQEHQHEPAFTEYVAYLRNTLSAADVKPYLAHILEDLHDYEAYKDECDFLFSIDPRDADDAGLLLQYRSPLQQLSLRQPALLANQHFTNVFAWKDFYNIRLRAINDAVAVFAENELGVFMCLPPLQATTGADTIDACFQYMESRNGPGKMSRVENVARAQLTLFDAQRYDFYEKGKEYVYERSAIAGLRGNLYKSKRADYNQFVKNYAASLRPFQMTDKDACLRLYDEWARQRKMTNQDELYRAMLEESRLAHQSLLRYYKELGLIGRVAVVNDHIKAYTLGVELTGDVFCVLAEVADLSCKGLGTYIFRELCADKEVSGYTFINVMDDVGLENMTIVKQSYHPALVEPLYVVTRKDHTPC